MMLLVAMVAALLLWLVVSAARAEWRQRKLRDLQRERDRARVLD